MASLRKPILAANWKMNLGPTAASGFFESFLSRYAARADRTVIVFPSAIALSAARHAAQARPDIQFGVQNVHTAEKGAFTGETSVSMAHDAGAHFVLVGHSERRHVFGETDAQTAEKVSRVSAQGLAPMLCVGEKIAVVAPMPRASDSTATPVTIGVALRARRADRRSFIGTSIGEPAREMRASSAAPLKGRYSGSPTQVVIQDKTRCDI